jgi:uncharacterized protein (DUF983 family)
MGRLYSGWIEPFPRCSRCGLIYERNQGDTWFCVHVVDRILLAVLIVLVYFGIPRTYPRLAVLAFVAVGAMLIWTTPKRWGICTALHYLTRAYSRDPDDPIPLDVPHND